MIYVYRRDASGNVHSGPDEQPTLPDQHGAWTWIDIVGEDSETISQVGARIGLDRTAIDEAIAQPDIPLIEEYAADVFVVLHGLSSGTEGRIDTPETAIFIGKNYLVTVRDGPRASIEDAKERFEVEGTLQAGTPAEFLAFLALIAGRRYGSLIPELERQLDDLEELAIQGAPKTAVEVMALRRDVIYLIRALGPQFDVIEELSETAHSAIDDAARKSFKRVASQHRRALDSLESSRALLGSVLETYRGAVADQTNEIMRVLTVFSAILLPLALIAGMWGMNFIDIPGANEESGFWILVGTMAIVAIGVWIYFARRGFIGAPRLRDLPKAVGLGLFTIGTAPIRAVAGGIKQFGSADQTDV